MTAREDVLARVRAALDATPEATAAAAAAATPRTYRQRGEHPPGHPVLLDLLVDRLRDYRAGVRRCDAAGLSAAVAAALADGLAAAGAGSAGRRVRVVVPPALPGGWLSSADVEVVTDGGLSASDLEQMGAVVTGATVAIAETGTIVLDGSPDQGRRAITLIPDVHVCVVRAGQVVETVPEALPRLDPARAQTWISGPSATSDIELVRVEGVHGPRNLEVVIVEASEHARSDEGDT